MDAIVFIILALILAVKPKSPTAVMSAQISNSAIEDTTREAKLNDSYYEDPNAFSEMINELGFPKERTS